MLRVKAALNPGAGITILGMGVVSRSGMVSRLRDHGFGNGNHGFGSGITVLGMTWYSWAKSLARYNRPSAPGNQSVPAFGFRIQGLGVWVQKRGVYGE